MNPLRAQQLQRRREVLLRRSRDLRHLSRIHARSLNPVLDMVDRVRGVLHWVNTRPPQLFWPVAALASWWTARRPGKVSSLILRVWSGWRMWQRFSAGRRV